MSVKSWLEPSRADAEAVAFRLTITNAFLFSATLITLSLNVSLIKQAFVAGGLGTAQWLLARTIVLMTFSAMILLFLGFVVLANTPLAQVNLAEILQRLDTARLFLAASGFMLFASYGSLFIISFGLANSWSWFLSAIAYGGAIVLIILRRYYLSKFATRKLPSTPKGTSG